MKKLILILFIVNCSLLTVSAQPLPIKIALASRSQKATVLNGTNQYWYKQSPTGLSFERTDSFTIVVALKFTTFAGGVILGREQNSGNLTGYIVASDVTTGMFNLLLRNVATTNELKVRCNGLSLNKWGLLIITYNGTSLASGVKMYVDGISQTVSTVTNTLTGSIVPSSINFQIGARESGGLPFAGSVGTVQIIKGLVMNDDICKMVYNDWKYGRLKNHYDGGVVVAWYDWQSAGKDKSGNGNDLTPFANPIIITNK